MKLSPNIKPGTYNFFCTLHRAGMTGKITVAGPGTKIPTPDEVTKVGKDQFKQLSEKLVPAATALKTGTAPPLVTSAAPGSVLAGSGSNAPDAQAALLTEFGPKDVSVPVGGAVTWTVIGPHTISFNAPEDARVLIAKAPDGSVHLNPKAAAPQGGPGAPPPSPGSGPPPTGPPPPPKVVDAGSWDGTGFRSSGLVLSFPPDLVAYKLSFSKAGTYSYVCLIHPDMKGTVKVG
jgi:plastocyanin